MFRVAPLCTGASDKRKYNALARMAYEVCMYICKPFGIGPW